LRMKRDFLSGVKVEEAFPGVDFRKKIVLVTGHRRESFGAGFRNICLALKELSRDRDDAVFVYPVHLNPNVRKAVDGILGRERNPRLVLTEPVGYLELLGILARSTLALTDSGGIQEEAPTFGVPVVVMRDRTERIESIRLGLSDRESREPRSQFCRQGEEADDAESLRGREIVRADRPGAS
jgi:UDP-N-acetylglucosamine 2-epimerase (non-hydrolysing)